MELGPEESSQEIFVEDAELLASFRAMGFSHGQVISICYSRLDVLYGFLK